MAKLKLTLLLTCICLVTFAQNSETRQLEKFIAISAGQGIQVNLEKGNKESCEINVSGMDVEDVITEVRGKKLRIRLADNKNHRRVEVIVNLSYVTLEEVEAHSGAMIQGKGAIKTNNLAVEVTSGAQADLDVEVEEIEIELTSSGHLSLTGIARFQDIEISSAGSLHAYDLICDDVSAEISSAGEAKVTASKQINALVSSAGSLKYKGDPTRTNVNTSSGGSVRKMN